MEVGSAALLFTQAALKNAFTRTPINLSTQITSMCILLALLDQALSVMQRELQASVSRPVEYLVPPSQAHATFHVRQQALQIQI